MKIAEITTVKPVNRLFNKPFKMNGLRLSISQGRNYIQCTTTFLEH